MVWSYQGFGAIVSRTKNNNCEVDKAKAVELIVLAYYHRDAQFFPDEWNPARVPQDDAGSCVERFVDIVGLVVSKVKGRVGNLLCPTFLSLYQEYAWANATLEYRQGAFVESMLEFASREESSTPNLASKISVVVQSEHRIINPTGKTKKPTDT